MGRGDKRRSRKVIQAQRQRKKKERIKRRIAAARKESGRRS